ncbi:SDR family NAD(P)-dependent oxidoreductase [Urechidicola croceus]|uniref:Short-chain dehydrogenase n=1 Tax=Urechidicola croceus TaxID=1850246 RepID=A0A1D8P6V5_9FLAO|nr:SDR family oxidoreductase [Urechidicola croceus]AOW20298.1 short-chain dehydrogenase [Urechidicola croceus]
MKNIVVTGASRGIGFELIQLYAKRNYNVLAISRNINPIQKLNIKNITALSIDISEEKEIQKVLNFVKTNWKKVDILINNAGKLVNKPFYKTSTEEFMDVYKVNVFAVAEITRVLIPFFTKGSHIVTISSMGGIQGSVKFPGLSAYSSSKGAVITLSELLAEEYKNSGVSFNVLAIGAVQTEMLSEAFPDYKAPLSAIEMAQYILNFSLTGNQFYNGKVLQVSSTTP